MYSQNSTAVRSIFAAELPCEAGLAFPELMSCFVMRLDAPDPATCSIETARPTRAPMQHLGWSECTRRLAVWWDIEYGG